MSSSETARSTRELLRAEGRGRSRVQPAAVRRARIGGPIARDRTFFFADYEGTRLAKASRASPTCRRRRSAPENSRSRCFARPVDPLYAPTVPRRSHPAVLHHPVGAAIAALYPLPEPQRPVANYVSSPTLDDDVHQFDVRIDTVSAAAMRADGALQLQRPRGCSSRSPAPAFRASPATATTSTAAGTTCCVALTHTPRRRW